MSLPYSVEVLFASMAEYNRLWFPEALVAPLLMLIALTLALRPLSGREGASARLVGALLAAAWAWVGWAYLSRHMALLDFLAPVYGGAWLLQGALLALTLTVLGSASFKPRGDARGWAALALALAGLIGYPLAVLLMGHDWRAVPLPGLAPDPTAVFAAGLLAAARERPPLYLFILPLGWAGVALYSGYVLGFALDYAVAASILAAAGLAIRARMRGSATPAAPAR